MADIERWLALIITVLLFTGAIQSPWFSLAHLHWFQVLTATNLIICVIKDV
ncbi:MAG: hypothetical protein ACRDRS_17200 [Pseudonocardiaceae bacterium]